MTSIKWKKFKSYFEPDNFWDLIGYKQYHDDAILYDYINYINNTVNLPLNLTMYKRKPFEYYERRNQAFQASWDIVSKPFYQSDSTDVKFVSLTPNDVSAINENDTDTEVLICISGFLSQRDNMHEAWHAVLDRRNGKPVFGFKWPAEDAYTLFQNIWLEILKIKFSEITKVKMGDIMTFNGVRSIAMDSGQLLAHALILEFPEYLPRVSLIGFSLGTQVIKS